MKKLKRIVLIIVALIVAGYFAGPKAEKPELNNELPVVQASIDNIQGYIDHREQQLKLKPDNEARIIWANDSMKVQTEFCLLYLHGFSASWLEGYPVHVDFAKRYCCNLYIPRLQAHGLDTIEPLLDYDPAKQWESAKEALMIARMLGKKIIIMSTSTGGTLSLKLAAEFPEYVHSLIMYSPNIRINNPAAFLLSGPWGLQLARKITGGNYRITNTDFSSKECQYWYCRYRLEGVVGLQCLVDATMKKETYARVKVPVFVGYYYKDEKNQDHTVKVSSILKMFDELGTPADKKVGEAFPDAGTHVIAYVYESKCVDKVKASTFSFADKVLGLRPVNQ
jgi:pimeloyl-ACP methyl ester carboxylesterase